MTEPPKDAASSLAASPPESTSATGYRLSNEVYQRLRRIAEARMAKLPSDHTTLQPTMLVHEAWIQLTKGERSWQNQGHFIASATLTMRRILIDHIRKKATIRKSIGDKVDDVELLREKTPEKQLMELDEAIDALEISYPLHARIVVAKFYGGLLTKEIAEELNIGERSVERYWAFAKVWLLRWIERRN